MPLTMESSCPCCGGDLVPLGQLGRLIHYRCRQCGAQTSETE